MIRVLIAEDIEPVLRRYGRILGTDPEIEVIAQVQTGEEAAREALLLHPDVILMDVEMETRTAGLDASRTILSQASPTPKIIILTVYEDDETVFEAFRLGVTDYVLKNSAPEELIGCVRDAYLNRSPIRPAIARKIRDEFQRIKKQEDSLLYCIHLASRTRSAIGENVTCSPLAAASFAATAAHFSVSSGANVAACPSGIGKIVFIPWITSIINSSGM